MADRFVSRRTGPVNSSRDDALEFLLFWAGSRELGLGVVNN